MSCDPGVGLTHPIVSNCIEIAHVLSQVNTERR